MKEALKLALEALMEHGTAYLGHSEDYQQAITASKEALTQPEQKPTAWMTDYENIMHVNDHARWVKFDGGKGFERFSDYTIPLYLASTKREWVGLTDEEIMEIDSTYYRPMGPLEFAKLLEAKLKEKNT